MVQTAGNADNVLKTNKCNPVSYYLSGCLDVDFFHIVKSENQRVALVDSRCFWGAYVVRACDRISDYSSR